MHARTTESTPAPAAPAPAAVTSTALLAVLDSVVSRSSSVRSKGASGSSAPSAPRSTSSSYRDRARQHVKRRKGGGKKKVGDRVHLGDGEVGGKGGGVAPATWRGLGHDVATEESPRQTLVTAATGATAIVRRALNSLVRGSNIVGQGNRHSRLLLRVPAFRRVHEQPDFRQRQRDLVQRDP